MIYGSIFFARIVSRSQLVASFVFKTKTSNVLFRSSTSLLSSKKNPGKDSVHPVEAETLKPAEQQSRLSAFYDEIFESDPPTPQISSSTVPSPSPVYPNFDELDMDDSNSEKDAVLDRNSNSFPDMFVDDSYPQGLPLERPQAPRKAPVEPTYNSKTKPRPSYTDTPRFPPKTAIPEKASNEVKRRAPFPPPVLEYDYSHYDPEFGAARPEEVTYNDFNEGMMDITSTVNPLSARRKKEDNTAQKKSNISMKTGSFELKKNVDDESNETASLSTKPAQNTMKVEVTSQQEEITVIESNDITEPAQSTVKVEVTSQQEEITSIESNVIQSTIQFSSSISGERLEFMKAAQNGSAVTSNLSVMRENLILAQSEIFKLNKNKKFNVNSPKQVSMVLFGIETASTNKDTLEAIVGSNSEGNGKLAELVLQIRKLVRDIKRMEKQEDSKTAGTHVSSVSSQRKKPTDSKVSTEKEKPTASKDSQYVKSIFNKDEGETCDPLVLIDASAFIFRAYYSMPPIHRKDGMPTGATLGFCNMINRLIMNQALRGQEPRVVLVFDSKDGTTFRKQLYPEYKSNRKPCPEDLIPQFDFVRDAATAYGIAQVEAPSYEADDVIATLAEMARTENHEVNILTGDKDLMQLVSVDGESNVHVIDPVTMVRYSHDSVVAKWGVSPALLGDLLALAGKQ
jgi:DNA polymerase-1